MNTGIVNDSLSICETIFNSIPPNDLWTIVNIAKTENRTFNYPTVLEIPWCYGYIFDAVPKFLKDEGVIEAWKPNEWFIKIASYSPPYEPSDEITAIAQKKAYFKKNETAIYYYKYNKYGDGLGPKAAGQYAILINKTNLITFYNKYVPKQNLPSQPTFNISSGELHFLGEKIVIDGEINRKTLNLLIKNINSRISYKEMYEVRENSNYDKIILGKGNTRQIHDAIDKVWRTIKICIEKNKRLNCLLICIQKDGFGIFIDKKSLELSTAPQKTPQKET